MLALWYDPGLLTGVTAYDFVTDQLTYCDEHDMLRIGEHLEGLHRNDVYVGWETYTIMKGPQTQAPWSLETIGVIKYICDKYGYAKLNPQAPKVREVCTVKMLRDIGIYDMVKGKKDALSSLQHMVAYMLVHNRLPKEWEPHVYGKLA